MASPAAIEDTTWKSDARDWIKAWAAFDVPITADDMRFSLREPPHPNMVGAAFRAACSAKIIRHIGYTESKAPSRKRSVIRVWAGTEEGVTK